MTIAFVLGNGISRQSVDLQQLKTLGKIYGCNAIYREFLPDVLISTDPPISERIQIEKHNENTVHYTRKPLTDSMSRRIAQKYFGFSSGPVAVGQAAMDGMTSVYLIGFDMGPTRNGRFNNVYADTEFYRKSSASPTFAGNWTNQLRTIMKDYPKTEFFRVVGDTTAEIKVLLGIQNLTHIPLKDLLHHVHNSA